MIRVKYLFLTVLAALVFIGCSKDDDALGSLGEISMSQTYEIGRASCRERV